MLSLINYAIKKNGIKLKKEFTTSLPQLMADQHKDGAGSDEYTFECSTGDKRQKGR